MVNRELAMKEIFQRAKMIKILLTDVDGVLTDTGVYYSDQGEELKRFSVRDGMGVQRLRELVQVETGIISGENSPSVQRRAEKLQITELYLGIKDKLEVLRQIAQRWNISFDQFAYIGDDTNDVEIMRRVGLACCPADAMPQAKSVAQAICENKGGYGAFREFAELIIASKQ